MENQTQNTAYDTVTTNEWYHTLKYGLENSIETEVRGRDDRNVDGFENTQERVSLLPFVVTIANMKHDTISYLIKK